MRPHTLALFTMAALLGAACSSAPETPDTPPVETPESTSPQAKSIAPMKVYLEDKILMTVDAEGKVYSGELASQAGVHIATMSPELSMTFVKDPVTLIALNEGGFITLTRGDAEKVTELRIDDSGMMSSPQGNDKLLGFDAEGKIVGEGELPEMLTQMRVEGVTPKTRRQAAFFFLIAAMFTPMPADEPEPAEAP